MTSSGRARFASRQAPDLAAQLLLGLFAHAAGVEDDHVGGLGLCDLA